MDKNIDINKLKNIYFVGIKGVAMTALAIVAKERGIEVSGSDIEEIFPTDAVLHKFNIKHKLGFNHRNIPLDTDLVIYTGAHQGINNSEVQTAKKLGIPVLPHGKALGLFMQGKRQISVAGSHGKTTTSAMISHILYKAGYDPSFAIGCGEIISFKTSGHAGQGDFFIAEADEYVTDPVADQKPRFLWQNPEALVVTNIDFDHPDVYKDLPAVQKAFIKFSHKVTNKGFIVCNYDDPATREILNQFHCKIVTYGADINKPNHYQYGKIIINPDKGNKTTFNIFFNNKKLGDFYINIPGEHNVANATATVATLNQLGIPLNKIITGLATFSGTKRRFELISDKNGKLLYDDYAHHPVEIAATLRAVRNWFPRKRIIAVFQSHTYSRTQALLEAFSKAFIDADLVLITDIYASAREKPLAGINGQLLFDKVKAKSKEVFYAPGQANVLEYLKYNTREGDLIITMGAGNIFTWLNDIKEVL